MLWFIVYLASTVACSANTFTSPTTRRCCFLVGRHPARPHCRPSRRVTSRSGTRGSGNGGGNNKIPTSTHLDFHHAIPPKNDVQVQLNCTTYSDATEADSDDNHTDRHFFDNGQHTVRGGGRLTKEKPDMLTSVATYWRGVGNSVVHTLTAPFKSLQKRALSLFQNKELKYEEQLMEQLRTIKIQRVTVPNSTVLPPDVVLIAAKRSGVLGNPLKSDLVQDFASSLKRWYLLQGYILHSVTGATLQPETATAEISVQEPVNDASPMGLSFYKEMVIDPETQELITYRQYKERHQQHGTMLGKEALPKNELNTTFVPTKGWTKPSRLAMAMGMSPGQPFQWDQMRWQKIASSGLFARILQAAPQPTGDGKVQMHVAVLEAPSKHLEYGVGKSLYSEGWEGELDFEHANLCGGGETLGVNVRRGTTEAIPSVRLKFSNGRLGLDGGYDVEAFSEFIGEDRDKDKKKTTVASKVTTNTGSSKDDIPSVVDASTEPMVDFSEDCLVDRRGATFRVKNPIDTRTIRNSLVSASVERTTTRNGLHETIGSTTIEVGPFLKELPMDARSNVDFSITTGAKFDRHVVSLAAAGDTQDGDSVHELMPPLTPTTSTVLPYISVSATTRQLFPLLSSSSSTQTVAGKRSPSRPLLLALKHSLTTSTNSLPKHMAVAIGTSNHIRGLTSNGRVASAVHGTTEIRVPIQLPSRLQVGQPDDASLVFYGVWLLSVKNSLSPIVRKSCVGVGLRKSIQGFPLQYDVTYSNEGKLKAMFGLGKDFVF